GVVHGVHLASCSRRSKLARPRGRLDDHGIGVSDSLSYPVQSGHGGRSDADHGNTASADELGRDVGHLDVHRRGACPQREIQKVCKLRCSVRAAMSYSEFKEKLDSILPAVEKPARYVGGEWNAVSKPADEIRTRIALCFPDTYEIGMSHLGLKILYSLLNKFDGWQAERVYAPWPDMEQKLREHRVPLLSLESF